MERFNSSFKGYNIEEVNSFVDKTAQEYSLMLEKLKSRDQEILALKGELEKIKSAGYNQVNSYAEMSSQITNMARNEARMILDDAKKNASRIVNDALLDAERIEMKAEQLRRNMVVFKRKLRTVIQSQLQTVEDIEELKLDE